MVILQYFVMDTEMDMMYDSLVEKATVQLQHLPKFLYSGVVVQAQVLVQVVEEVQVAVRQMDR